MIIQEKPKHSEKSLWKKITVYAKIATALALVALTVCVCFAGSTDSVGKSAYAEKDTSVVFYLDYQDDSGLSRVYVNIGAIYAEPGSVSKLAFRRATTSGEYTENKWISSGLGNVGIYNLYETPPAEEEKEPEYPTVGGNYEWVEAFRIKKSNSIGTNYNLIKLTFPCGMVVNEVVFADKNKEVIPAYTQRKDVEKFISVDRWNSYYPLFYQNDRNGFSAMTDSPKGYDSVNSRYTDYTMSEKKMLMQLDNVLLGSRLVEGYYNIGTGGGPLTDLIALTGRAIFGQSAFGLRVLFIACASACAVMAYLLGKRVTGKPAVGLAALCAVTACGIALTFVKTGLQYGAYAFFVFAAVYFMLKFTQKGISYKKPRSSSGNILLSGAMFSLAFAALPWGVFAVVPVVGLFAFGAVRQSVKRRAALENSGVAKEALKRQYGYEKRLMYGFFALSILITVFVYILTALPFMNVYLHFYDNPAEPTLDAFQLIWRGLCGLFRG